MWVYIPFLSSPADGSFSVTALTEGQQMFLCVVLATLSSFYDYLSGTKHLTPMSFFLNMMAGAIVGLLVFLVTIEEDRVRPSWRLALALASGFVRHRVVGWLREGTLLARLLERIGVTNNESKQERK